MRPTVDEMEEFFKDAILPDGPIQTCQAEKIMDPVKFIEGHIDILRANPGKKRYLPYYERLERFYHMVRTGNYNYQTLNYNTDA